MRSMFAGASLGVFMLGSAAVSAAPVTLQVCTDASCWSGAYTINDGVVVNWTDVQTMDNGAGNSVDDWETAQGLNLSNWSLTMDTDPFVTNNFSLTNNTLATQTYSLSTTIGITPVIPNALMRGSIAFTLTDNGNDVASAVLQTSSASIYTATIDGNSARTLWDSPTVFTTNSSTGGGTDFGFPAREVAPESVDTNIGIAILFSLSAGDSVSFTSNFDVVPVPVPAAVWLFGSGLLALFGVTQRKQRF